jgi:hypothetical protein
MSSYTPEQDEATIAAFTAFTNEQRAEHDAKKAKLEAERTRFNEMVSACERVHELNGVIDALANPELENERKKTEREIRMLSSAVLFTDSSSMVLKLHTATQKHAQIIRALENDPDAKDAREERDELVVWINDRIPLMNHLTAVVARHNEEIGSAHLFYSATNPLLTIVTNAPLLNGEVDLKLLELDKIKAQRITEQAHITRLRIAAETARMHWEDRLASRARKEAYTAARANLAAAIRAAMPSEDKECCICMGTASSRLFCRTKCMHSFHKACLAPWLANHTTCPMCRAVLK